MYQSRHLANTRIDVADALRGIAVAGIILYHSVEHFNIFTQEPITHTLATDQMVADVLAWLLSGKMYGIFAMLFGLSFFIMNDNQQQKGNNFSGRFAWRMCLLFLFGIVNVAFYDGDILMLYACYGLLLIPISYLPSKWVWCIIALLAIQPVELFCLLTGTTIDHSTLWEVYSKINSAHEHGTFWENTLTNLRYGFEVNFRFNIFSGRLTQLLCLFILGMQLGRQRMFYNEGRNLQIWHQLLWRSALVVVVLSIVDFSEIASWLNPIYNLMILMMIVSAIVSAWYASEGVRKVLHHLCIFGRMSLTNYLLQSVIGCAIFCGYGLACYRHLGVTYAVMVGCGMVVCQYLFARYWFSNHPRGPLEGLWRKLTWIRVLLLTIVLGVQACSAYNDKPVATDVQSISEEMAAVRDYVPLYAVIAHRGSTYWTPEETESAWRWAREMGVDYLESDLQCSKDGIIIANHDDNLKRTTNIDEVFGATIPATRIQFYESLGFSHEDALEQYQRDEASFRPYYMQSYYYAELLMLDAGKWFAEAFAASRNGGLIDGKLHYSTGQYVSALHDQIAYASGRMLHRKDDGERILPYRIKPEYQGKTLHEIWQSIAEKGAYKDIYMDFIDYDFADAYVADTEDTGHRPGIYLEFKEPEVNPENMEQRVYDILDSEGWNIITRPATETAFYVNGKVNVGRTKGKVILQTFSNEALRRSNAIFQGRVPMCYLLWLNHPSLPEDFALTTPDGFAQAIKYAQDHGAHIIGPSIAGEPNNYDELNAVWQARLTRRSGMLNHPYSFDTQVQMSKYVDTTEGSIAADGCFTNRADLSLQYMIDHGLRGRSDIPNPFHPGSTYDNSQASRIVPDAVKTLERLGYLNRSSNLCHIAARNGE